MVRESITRIQNLLAARRLRATTGIAISPTAKIEYRKIRIKPGCEFSVGDHSMVSGSIAFEREGASVRIGARSFVGGSHIISSTSIEIGDDVLISWGCTLVDHNSHSLYWEERSLDVMNWYAGQKDWSSVKSGAIRVRDKSWIGFGAIILKGVTVEEGAVVGAGSVVTHDVPAYTLVAGNPAKVIREIGPAER